MNFLYRWDFTGVKTESIQLIFHAAPASSASPSTYTKHKKFAQQQQHHRHHEEVVRHQDISVCLVRPLPLLVLLKIYAPVCHKPTPPCSPYSHPPPFSSSRSALSLSLLSLHLSLNQLLTLAPKLVTSVRVTRWDILSYTHSHSLPLGMHQSGKEAEMKSGTKYALCYVLIAREHSGEDVSL